MSGTDISPPPLSFLRTQPSLSPQLLHTAHKENRFNFLVFIHHLLQMAENHIAELITRLSSEIEKDSEVIERKRKRCDPEELDDLQFDVANKRQHLNKLQTDSKAQKKRAKRHKYLLWRSSLRRQLGKNRNQARIDRGAETAVYNVVYEQLKAHDR